MFDKLKRLPFSLAHRVARKIQEDEERLQAELRARQEAQDAADTPVKEEIPEHELADLSADTLLRDADELLDDAPVLVDVRAARDHGDGHLPDAVSMPEIEVMIRLAELPADRPVVAYSEGEEPALRVARFLRARGFHQAFALRGGIQAWEDAGGRIEA